MSTFKLILRAIEEEVEKCQPDYIQDLPYDLKTTDLDKLNERLDVINERIESTEELIGTELWIQEDRKKAIDDLEKENKEWQERIDSVDAINKEFDELDESTRKKAKELSKKIVKDLKNNLENRKIHSNFLNSRNQKFADDYENIEKLFDDFGFITGDKATDLHIFARALRDYADNEVKNAPSEEKEWAKGWAKNIKDSANNIETLADNCNINKNKKASDLLNEYGDWKENKEEWQKNITNNIKEINRSQDVIKDSEKVQTELEVELKNFNDAKDKTTEKINELK